MSWVHVAVSRSSEDIFDEDADEMYLLQKEWNSTMKRRLKGTKQVHKPRFLQQIHDHSEWGQEDSSAHGIAVELGEIWETEKQGFAACVFLDVKDSEGYRDGVEAGKELALQEGFNQGYRRGAELMVTCGQFRGTLNALSSWCHFNGHESALSEINNLLNIVGKHEEDVLEYLNSTEQQPHLGHILDSVEDMDLNNTAPAGTECNEDKTGKHEDIGSSGENVFRNNGEVGSLQPDGKAELFTDPERSTLAWVKKQTIWLVEQLGLSLDVVHHVQQLEH